MPSLKGCAILIVEDERVVATAVQRTLDAQGAVTRIASSVDQAEVTLSDFDASVVLLDLVLPGFNGLELARRLRADSTTRPRLIVAMTGWQGEDADRTCRAAGCDAYIAKPFASAALTSLLSRLVERRPH